MKTRFCGGPAICIRSRYLISVFKLSRNAVESNDYRGGCMSFSLEKETDNLAEHTSIYPSDLETAD